MNDAKLAHPSLDQLAAFAQGRLTEAEIAELSLHLSACPECVASVEASGDDTLISLLRAADTEHDRDVPPKPMEAETLALPGETSGVHDLPVQLAAHGRYRIQELLGVGGMGAVYKAEHLLMERPVALKLISHSLTSNPAMVERFRREVKTAGQLRHSNIVMAYDAEQAGDSHFLVMEYVEGKSLASVVKEQGKLSVPQACEYIRQAACGLAYAHERGMVHRDIKPQNLMLTPDGQVKILDFGLARFAMEAAPTGALLSAPITDTDSSGDTTGSLTQAGAVMGTPDYIAPEQAKDAHTADIRADIYSLGCTLYDLLAGHAPFPEGTVLDKVLAHAERSPKPLTELRRDVSPALVRVVDRMMAKDPTKRYQTPAEVAAALAPFAAAPKLAEGRGRIRRRTLVALAAAACFALLAGGVVYYWQTSNGVVRFEINDPDIKVMLDQDGPTITGADKEPIKVKVGTHELTVTRGDFTFGTTRFDLKRGGQTKLKIEWLDGDTLVVMQDGREIGKGQVSRFDNTKTADQDAKIAAAAKAAEAYLKTLDAGEYAALWDLVATWAKEQGHTKEKVVQTYESLAKVSGKLISRTPDKPKYLTAPGAGLPEGEYVLFGYNSRFERMDPAVEQLGLMLEKDGQWRTILYARLMSDTPATDSVHAQGPAVVGAAQAKFTIPVPEKKVWSWYLADTPANQEEYHWMVKVTNNGKSYSFGYSLYKMRDQKPASGTLQELLNAGQVNLWTATKEGGEVVKGDVRVRAEGNSVVITMDDKKLLSQLFSTKPESVDFETALPGDEKVTTRTVAVTYEPADKDAKIEAAGKAIEAWLKLVDAGDYGRAWEQCAQSVRDPISKQNFIFIYEGSSKATGKLKSRTFLRREYTTKLPGSPDGEYVVFTYRSSFENEGDATQQVVATLEKDGVWRISQYVTFPAAAASASPRDEDRLQGTWRVIKGVQHEQRVSDDEVKRVTIKFVGNTIELEGIPGGKGTFELDASKTPKRLTVTFVEDGKAYKSYGVYLLDGDTLRFCIGSPDEGPVKDFDARVDMDLTLRRETAAKPDQELIQGTWKGVGGDVGGKPIPELLFQAVGPTITFADKKVTWKANPSAEAKDFAGGALAKFSLEGVFDLDPAKSPKTINLTILGSGAKTPLGTPAPRALLGIYRFDGDKLEVCIAIDPDHPEERPTKFESAAGKAIGHIFLKREPANTKKSPKTQRPPGEGVPAKYRESINKGLAYLAQAQQKDGHWEAEGGHYPTAMTALAGMAMLMEGSTLEEGKYADSLRRAVDWLTKRCQPNGLIGDPAGEDHRYMFAHGYGLLFLASVYGQEENGERRAKLEKILTKAVEFTGDAQSHRGGWGYLRAADGGDFDEGASTVVQLQGLRAARNAGIVVPKKLIDIDYLRQCTTKNGGIIYSITRPEDGDRPAVTAAALACMYTAGDYDSDLARKWLKYCQPIIRLDASIGFDEFTHYYYAQALYILGDQGYEKLFPNSKPAERLTWSKYREAMFDSLLKRQAADGSWSSTVGPVYSTACWLTVLQLDEATLQIYRR